MDKYSFDKLRQHTETIRQQADRIFSTRKTGLDEAFLEFGQHFSAIQEQDKSLERNVRLLFASRFLNHVYSALLLVEAGMYSDALTCERSAIESLAGYRLLCAEPVMAEKYNAGKFPKPVEVRKKLEQLGYAQEVEHIQSLYKSASGITHLSRENERFLVNWKESNDGELRIGGVFSETDLDHMLEFLPALLFWFVSPINQNG